MKRYFIFLFGWIIVDACIDRIDFDIPIQYSKSVVIDGVITNEPGPYTVKLSSVIRVDDTRPNGIPMSAKKVTMFDNAGNQEVLEQIDKGIYQTKPGGMQGVLGREYFIRIEMEDGNVFESVPDKMDPVGAVDSIYYEFESYQPTDAPTAYQYRIFMNAHSNAEASKYIRWKFNGTYEVETKPQFTHCLVPDPVLGCTFCPALCSGYAWVIDTDGVLKLKEGYAFNPITRKTEYVIGLKCTCCRCWVTPREERPKVNDGQISANGIYTKVEMGTIPVNFYTFFERYRVEIEQMSLSRFAFDYWSSITSQKEAVGSIFQPVTGKIPTNIFEINKKQEVQGLFYAAAVTRKQIYLDRNTHHVEIYVPQDYCQGYLRDGAVGLDCRIAFPGSTSTNVKPADWKY